MQKKPFALIVLDGWGINPIKKGNAVALADKPTYDYLLKNYPHSKLKTSGSAVGLPDGQIGGSEVGHLHLGSGRLIPQELVKINNFIKDKSFFKNKALIKAIDHASKKKSAIHLMGLLSGGGVHSHINHLFALLALCRQRNADNVKIHCFLDGRDVPQKSAKKYIKMLEDETKKIGLGRISTLIGRYYAMDRDKRWERTHIAYDALVHRIGRMESDPIKAVDNSYKSGETDEFVKPVVFDNIEMKKDDSVIFFNFRGDRAREITEAFVKNTEGENPCAVFTCLTVYEKGMENVAFKENFVKNTLGYILSKQRKAQLRIAETEKYAHVTFFFSGGREKKFEGEDRILIPSPKVATYDLMPEMSAREIADALVAEIHKGRYDFILVNFANPDMVGHTGMLDKAIIAIETVDECLTKVLEAIREKDGTALIVADHGNAEQMIDYKTGEPHTAHTLNPVNCILFDKSKKDIYSLEDGTLHNIAPTILELMKIKKPKDMKSKSLLVKKQKR